MHNWVTYYSSTVFVIVKYWKQPKYTCIGEWLNKLWYIHTMESCTDVRRVRKISTK